MEPIPVWVFIKVEVTTDGGLIGHYWLAKLFSFPGLPPIGLELDYRSKTRETVMLDKLLYEPERNEYRGYQDAWFSISVGDLALWEHAGWQKMNMTDEDVQANK